MNKKNDREDFSVVFEEAISELNTELIARGEEGISLKELLKMQLREVLDKNRNDQWRFKKIEALFDRVYGKASQNIKNENQGMLTMASILAGITKGKTLTLSPERKNRIKKSIKILTPQ